MTTDRFNRNLLAAARRLKDQRTDPTSSGDVAMRYSSALLTYYQNRAVSDVFQSAIKNGKDLVDELVPESIFFRTVETQSGIADIPDDIFELLEVSSATAPLTRYHHLVGDIAKVEDGGDPLFLQGYTPYWFLSGGSLYIRPWEALNLVIIRYIKDPGDITVNGSSDLSLLPKWDGQIVDRMVELALKDTFAQVPAQQ
jgi:hypothetical protein